MRMKNYPILMKNVVFNCNGMGVFNIGLNNNNNNNNNNSNNNNNNNNNNNSNNNNNNLGNSFDEDDPDNIILIRSLAWHIST